ncbi:unnamed protein product, partial [Rotaria sp. Silwood2]
MLYLHAKDISAKESFELLSNDELCQECHLIMVKKKSTSISTAKRLTEFLGEDVIKDKGLCCRFVIAIFLRDAPVTECAISLAIYQSEYSVRHHYLRKWLHLSTVDNLDIREILDWNYYIDRFTSFDYKLLQIKIKVPRIFYVNYCTSIELNSNQTQRSANYERIILNCSQKNENISRNYYTGIMTVLSNPNIKDVYQINAPLDFYLLAIHG